MPNKEDSEKHPFNPGGSRFIIVCNPSSVGGAQTKFITRGKFWFTENKNEKKNVIKTSDIYQKENLYKYCEEHCPYRAENIASLPFQIISPVVRVSVSGSAMKQREICREVVAQPPLPHATCQHYQPRRAVRLPQPVATMCTCTQ